ncbi:MAG: FkbM family methyltransferase [Rubellimicrobium sp.]|nr:FkbM family methyltransferase [Rubellimicrobium sp.]
MARPSFKNLVETHFDGQDSFIRFARAYMDVVRRQKLNDRENLMQFIAFATTQGRRSHGQNFQDMWALWESGRKRVGWFVEFGAGNGVALSNTWYLENHYGWTGVVAEPNPNFAPMVRAARKCHVSDRCVYSRSGERIAFLPTEMGELSRIRDIVPADSHELYGGRDIAPGAEVMVETISLNDLLTEARAPREIDFLSVDTEGSEFEILQAFDFDRWRFGAICVEHNGTALRTKLFDLLTKNGYRRKFEAFSAYDDWYVPADRE